MHFVFANNDTFNGVLACPEQAKRVEWALADLVTVLCCLPSVIRHPASFLLLQAEVAQGRGTLKAAADLDAKCLCAGGNFERLLDQ